MPNGLSILAELSITLTEIVVEHCNWLYQRTGLILQDSLFKLPKSIEPIALFVVLSRCRFCRDSHSGVFRPCNRRRHTEQDRYKE